MCHLHQHVLGLQVGVDYAALVVQVTQSLENLLDDDPHMVQRQSRVVGAHDQLEQGAAENFEDHARVFPIHAVHFEAVQELDHPALASVRALVHAFLQNLNTKVRRRNKKDYRDLVGGGYSVVFRRLDDLQRDKASGCSVPAQPNGRKVAPADFPDHVVAAVEHLAQLHRVVAAGAVVARVLLLFGRLSTGVVLQREA